MATKTEDRRSDYQKRNKAKGICTKCTKKAHKWGLCRSHYLKQKGYYAARKAKKKKAGQCFWCHRKAVTKWACKLHLHRTQQARKSVMVKPN